MSGTPERLADERGLVGAILRDVAHTFGCDETSPLVTTMADVLRRHIRQIVKGPSPAELLRAAPPPAEQDDDEFSPVTITEADRVRLAAPPPQQTEPAVVYVSEEALRLVALDGEVVVGICAEPSRSRVVPLYRFPPPALEPGQRIEGNVYESAEGIGFYETTQPPAAPGHRRATLIIHGASGEGNEE